MRVARLARLLAALTMMVVVLTAAGCASSDETETKPRGKTEIGDPASVTSSTAGGSASTEAAPTQVPSSPTGLGSPEAAAGQLYSSWRAGDRAAALQVAEPIAVDAVFTAADGDYQLYNACDTGEYTESGCLYRGDNGSIQFTMEKRNDLWVVISAFYAAA